MSDRDKERLNKNAYMREWRERNREKNRAYNKEYSRSHYDPEKEKARRDKTIESRREYQREYRKRNAEKLKLAKHKHWNANRERARELGLEERRRLRHAVFSFYGLSCKCCGESDEAFLTIDHIDGNGTNHRNEIGGGGITTYRWLRQNNFPPGFQTLCMNCNFAKGKLGRCPHQDDRKEK